MGESGTVSGSAILRFSVSLPFAANLLILQTAINWYTFASDAFRLSQGTDNNLSLAVLGFVHCEDNIKSPIIKTGDVDVVSFRFAAVCKAQVSLCRGYLGIAAVIDYSNR